MAPRLVSSRVSIRFSLVSFIFSPLSKLHFHYCQAIHFHSIIFPNFHIYLFAFSNEDTKRRDEPPSSAAAAAAAAARLMATNCQNVNEPKCLQGVGGGGGRHFDGVLDYYRAQSSTNFLGSKKQQQIVRKRFSISCQTLLGRLGIFMRAASEICPNNASSRQGGREKG